jgi:membrane-associated protease RseP (regulator of RpoE activity)
MLGRTASFVVMMVFASASAYSGQPNPNHIVRSSIGIVVQEVTPEVAESIGHSATGALIVKVTQGGPADVANIRRGDIVETFGATKISTFRLLPWAVQKAEIGKPVDVTISRKGKELTLTVTPGAVPGDIISQPPFGVDPHDSVSCSIEVPDGIQVFWSTSAECNARIASAISSENRERVRLQNEESSRIALVKSNTQAAIQGFCATATGTACSLFKSAAYECLSQSEDAYLAFRAYSSMRSQGVPTNIIIDRSSNIQTGPYWDPQIRVTNTKDWTIVASQEPPETTAPEFQTKILEACLDRISH